MHKVIIKKDGIPHIFKISLDSFTFKKQKFITVVLNDITELENTKKDIELIHKNMKDSIEYASLIQRAIVAHEDDMKPFFKDSFSFWSPKDIVGGDIWLFNRLRHEDECLLLVIDCTGHGVPGAFVTMVVKSIEREIISKITKNPDLDISPAKIMQYFNKTMKELLNQMDANSVSNAGFDGGIIYYNKREQILKFAGAETPLFYITADGEFKTIKGNRYSVGYKKNDLNYEYKETIIEVEEGMKFFCTTDGYIDQNGGAKGFPFGKKRFGNIIKENYQKPMKELKEIFIQNIKEWQEAIPDNGRNDDMTVIGFEIGPKSTAPIIKEIVKYEGVITQNVISAFLDNIEAKIKNINLVGTVSTVTIELCQNMMHYSKDEQENSREILPAGEIKVISINDLEYEIVTKNIISIEDKEKIEPVLTEIKGLDRSAIKKKYRELRKTGQNAHAKGGGIGFYEIAKVCEKIDFEFEEINKDKLYFTFKTFIKRKSKEKK